MSSALPVPSSHDDLSAARDRRIAILKEYLLIVIPQVNASYYSLV